MPDRNLLSGRYAVQFPNGGIAMRRFLLINAARSAAEDETFWFQLRQLRRRGVEREDL